MGEEEGWETYGNTYQGRNLQPKAPGRSGNNLTPLKTLTHSLSAALRLPFHPSLNPLSPALLVLPMARFPFFGFCVGRGPSGLFPSAPNGSLSETRYRIKCVNMHHPRRWWPYFIYYMKLFINSHVIIFKYIY